MAAGPGLLRLSRAPRTAPRGDPAQRSSDSCLHAVLACLDGASLGQIASVCRASAAVLDGSAASALWLARLRQSAEKRLDRSLCRSMRDALTLLEDPDAASAPAGRGELPPPRTLPGGSPSRAGCSARPRSWT
jgi:hypothetical protein